MSTALGKREPLGLLPSLYGTPSRWQGTSRLLCRPQGEQLVLAWTRPPHKPFPQLTADPKGETPATPRKPRDAPPQISTLESPRRENVLYSALGIAQE